MAHHNKHKNINWHTVATSVIGGVLVITIAGFGKMVINRGERITHLEKDVALLQQKLNEHLRDYNQDKEQAK